MRALVGRKISAVGDKGTPDYRREHMEFFQVKKDGYPLDMESFWRLDKFPVIAVTKYFSDQLCQYPGLFILNPSVVYRIALGSRGDSPDQLTALIKEKR
ncbi:MAG: hypothetical protein WBV23_14575 [Desulfobaccales bacterium]